MELIPRDDLKAAPSFNFAPMIDFLFLMLALFATLAVSRAALFDTEIKLAKVQGPVQEKSHSKGGLHVIHVSINGKGMYKWLTEFQEYGMPSTQAIQKELARQYELGSIPAEKSKTEVLLHIDENAPWHAIADAIFAIREIGFSARPVYEPLSGRSGE